MTVVPLPASPCVRVRLVYTNNDNTEAGNRFYLKYTGSAPTAGDCNTLATDIGTTWTSELASLINTGWTLTEVDVLDIASVFGLSGAAHPNSAGTAVGLVVPAQSATNIEFDLARRYRGGKPRMYLPPPGESEVLDSSHWTAAHVSAAQTQVPAFFSAIAGLAIGAMGTLSHVNLSYYSGFKNVTNSSGRTRAAPQYRDTALVDAVTGYAIKAVMGSQRRRRTSTTP